MASGDFGEFTHFVGCLKFKLAASMPEQLKITTIHFCEAPQSSHTQKNVFAGMTGVIKI